ncbi:hypothetical protein BGZ60DRAFT_363651 [Tricladium varicosporioides]|nr:hypothetical protein BGZ60DRAFT_363651 [Hymenoscyphus varicosporioides]
MCGRYCLVLRPAQVRAYLEEYNMPVYEAPPDDGDHAPRQSYNFAPGYHGMVYRADVPDYGARPRQHEHHEGKIEREPMVDTRGSEAQEEVRYKLQSMKWGLIPFWTKRNPDYGSMLKTINCRDDSLIENRGMWNTMKQNKRCIVVAQGFYEWLKKGKEKVPHYIKRKDGKLMCMAGLWDCVQYEGSEDKNYTYAVITTDSNKQLKFLHDRMPVIFNNGSEEILTWLDPNRHTWTKELQGLLKPFNGELEIYPVSKEVGKVGNNSPTFIVPITSSENKSNIANFFAKGAAKADSKTGTSPKGVKLDAVKKEEMKEDMPTTQIKQEPGDDRKTIYHSGIEDSVPLPIPEQNYGNESQQGVKRESNDVLEDGLPKRVARSSSTPTKSPSQKPTRKTRSAKSNNTASPSKSTKGSGSQKITNFFSK